MNKVKYQIPRKISRGFSLVELMVAMVIGLLVLAAAGGIFLTNRRTYTATENLSRLQENARFAFELMSRDIREASGNACNSGRGMAMVNVLNDPATRWWSDWQNGAIRGFGAGEAFPDSAFGTGAGQRLAGTEALALVSGGNRTALVTGHNPGGTEFTVSNAAHGFTPGDILIACGPNSEVTGVLRLGAIFQMTGVAGSTAIRHDGGGGSPGNATGNLGLDNSEFTFAPNTTISDLHAVRWYIANNGRGGRSLYQGVLTGNGVVQNQEVVDNVQSMALEYLVPSAGGYLGPAAVAGRWGEVSALRISLQQSSQDRVSTDNQALQRTVASVVTLRNRNP
ncbi:MAG: prepilin-type N-terminal cleavage/methylation domain-containing protein [Xanthomonadaceae bacterium]|nr:prepilin-type N-terminal cleavage/methylation domain-containing protein [Xanthomonadaceae bacterium]